MAAMIYMTSHLSDTEPITVSRISSELGISKIYLEQVFALLKRGGFVKSIKGAQGGYYLNKRPESISAYDILQIEEGVLFEGSQEIVMEKAPQIDRVIREDILSELDVAIKSVLTRLTISSLAEKATTQTEPMYYI